MSDPTAIGRGAIRRNTALLAAGLACLFGMAQLVAAVSTVTFVAVTGSEGLLGVGPAIILFATAAAAFPAGHAMDRVGRIPVLVVGFAAGIGGSALLALGAGERLAVAAIAGFALVGVSLGIVNLSRAAAADMYPPERRGRGVSLVVFGAVFGAALGPLVFAPLFGGHALDPGELVVPWLVSAAIMAVGLAIVLFVRPDPARIAAARGPEAGAHRPARPLGEIVRRPGALAALVAAIASFAVMVSVMNLTGYVVVDHGHEQHEVFPIVSAHLVGMFGLVLVVGDLIDRLGRLPALVGGLLLVGISCASLIWVRSVPLMALALFGLGLGWNFAYVAATTQLSDIASAAERGRLLGLSDGLSALLGGLLALGGGLLFTETGVLGLGAGAALLALLPSLWVLTAPRLRPRSAGPA